MVDSTLTPACKKHLTCTALSMPQTPIESSVQLTLHEPRMSS